MNVQTLRITGMTCDHCAKSIEGALASVAGVVEAKVSYDEGDNALRLQFFTGLLQFLREEGGRITTSSVEVAGKTGFSHAGEYGIGLAEIRRAGCARVLPRKATELIRFGATE